MWNFNKMALVALLLMLSAAARGDGISGSGGRGAMGDGVGGGVGAAISNSGGFTGTAPVSCGTGVVDLSTGCTQPMVGGL
jgi:hypothetical protein